MHYVKKMSYYVTTQWCRNVKNIGGPVVIGGDNLPSPVRIGLTDLQNIGGPVAPLAPPVPAPLLEINKIINSISIHPW